MPLGLPGWPPERVADVLRLRPEDVPAIAAGKVRLAKSVWRRVLRDVGAKG